MGYRSAGRMLVLSAIALSPLCAQPVQAQDAISVMSFGGAYQEAQRKAVFETYTASTGIKIDEQEYGGEIAKIKAMIESGNTTVDAVDVDAPTLLQGCDEGIFEKIDWSKIGPEDDWIQGTTSDCGVGTIVYATILAYDGAKLKDGPKTIKDLFDIKKFPGKRGLWKNPATNLEFALLADGVTPDKIYETLSTPEGVDRAFAKLDTIKDSIVWWEAGAQAPQLLASGEVAMTTAWNGRIYNANKEGKDFRIVWDNQILDSNYWAIPKGAKTPEASVAFIKYAAEQAIDTPLSVAETARRLSVSRRRLERHFQQAVGMAPTLACKIMRLEHAEFLLRQSDQSVTEIAAATGFCDSSHFARAFRGRCGMTSAMFRRTHAVQAPARQLQPHPGSGRGRG